MLVVPKMSADSVPRVINSKGTVLLNSKIRAGYMPVVSATHKGRDRK